MPLLLSLLLYDVLKIIQDCESIEEVDRRRGDYHS